MLTAMRFLLLIAVVFVVLPGCTRAPAAAAAQNPGGIRIMRDRDGLGRPARNGDVVRIAIELRRESGQRLITDADFRFRIGAGSVIDGVEHAVIGMRAGGERTCVLPPQQHWGRDGYANGAVPPGEDLILDVKLLDIRVGDPVGDDVIRAARARRAAGEADLE
jgi:FKBP-type peptidyl-prolyl cis-trans isomerase